MKTISEINKIYKETPKEDLRKFVETYGTDERKGVMDLVIRAKKDVQVYEKEKKRLYSLREFERKYDDCAYICGIDEVGRGPLAGPVVAGAVILPKDLDILYVNDSKQLSKKTRERLCEEIMNKALTYAVASVEPEEIDELNILQATYVAMRSAISKLKVIPDILFNDAVHIPAVGIRQISIVKGDAKSISIASASIIAKVKRDAIMVEYDRKYPEYGFASNKGYGSKEHIEALKKYGPCPIHRKSFIEGILNGKN